MSKAQIIRLGRQEYTAAGLLTEELPPFIMSWLTWARKPVFTPLAEVEEKLIEAFGEVFELNFRETGEDGPVTEALPSWLMKKAPASSELKRTKNVLRELGLKNVCQGGKCPNIATCYGKDTATFLILGDTCTRRCRMCAVPKGKPLFPDLSEAERVAQAVCEIMLRHAVITSVTRDDLPDGGAGVFAAVIRSIREMKPTTVVEVLTPDFRGDVQALTEVIKARPSIFNHNLETVPRLYYRVRPQADYRLSLDLLAKAKKIDPGVKNKSGLLLGFGESFDEVLQVMKDLRGANCDILTIGQYLQPSQSQLPVVEYVKPEVFEELEKLGKEMGFIHVAAGPFVRSSYQPDRNQ